MSLRFGPLQDLLDDEEVTEIMANGPGAVWVERRGRLEAAPVRLDRAGIDSFVERALAHTGRRVDRHAPFVDARLADGSRLNVVVPPVAVDGPYVTVRRFGARRVALEDLVAAPVAALLGWAVRARCNIVVSGGAGAGKTTLLNALGAHVPAGQRIVTVEDAAELSLGSEHVVRLEARPPNGEGAGRVSIRDLVTNALRMRPDRIVVGEVRGPEALEMLQAMNTGHEGSMSTCHANSPVDALRRIETMVLLGELAGNPRAVRELVRSSIDLVVHLARRADGFRDLAGIEEVVADGGGSLATRTLATSAGVIALPARLGRAAGGPSPDPAWLG